MNPTARRNAREFAVQALYQWQISHTPTKDLETEFLTRQIKKKNTDLDYFKELIQGITQQQANLDQQMVPYLARPITELDPVELAILRLAVFELMSRLDIPYRVVINEALELTKKFGSAEGFKFVNGVLDKVSKQLRAIECNAKRKN